MERDTLRRKILWISGVLFFLVLAFVVSIFFLNPSSVGNRNFLWFFNLWASVWTAIFMVVLVLTFVLARNLIKLLFEYQTPTVEGRIKRKLILTLVIFALFPALIMFFVAFGLINQNLQQWASSPSEQLHESSKLIAEEYYRAQREKAYNGLVAILSQIGPEPEPERLQELGRQYGFHEIALLRGSGEALSDPDRLLSRTTSEQLAGIVEDGFVYSLIKSVNQGSGVIIDEGFAGLQGVGPASYIVIARVVAPRSVAFHAERVEAANEAFQGIRASLNSLRIIYFSVLLLTTLAVVFGFVWLGNYIARKLAGPIEALADGSRALADGNLDHRVKVEAVDELRILVDAFNRMATQLRENRLQLERAYEKLKAGNVRLDERRKYIETILQNIATAVLTVDRNDVIRTVNGAALKMFQTSLDRLVNRSMEEVAPPKLYQEFQTLRRRAELYGTARKQVSFDRGRQTLLVAATVTMNEFASLGGVEYLIVLDELTELIRTEKFAAWQEVARRLAHEIKNPLTPIQLSAQRIRKQFKKVRRSTESPDGLQPFEDILDEATDLIVTEAKSLKGLVSEFSQFARLPICESEPVPLHDIIQQALALYDGGLQAIQIDRQFDSRIETINADPEQLRRVFVNLIDNSLDALAESDAPRTISLRTTLNRERGTVKITVEDTGVGIPPDDYEHLFLPYFSTKKKGTGLGLAIVRQIVSEHHGFIRAEPNVPQGTRVIMELPLE